jgi:hypothetical protein
MHLYQSKLHKFLKAGHPDLERAWQSLPGGPSAYHALSGEVWQYIVLVNKMLHLPGSCFEVDWLIRPSFREGFDLQDMFDPYINQILWFILVLLSETKTARRCSLPTGGLFSGGINA